MKITLVPADAFAQVGADKTAIDLSDMPPNIHAVQWDERGETNTGHVEYNDGTANQAIDTLADFQPWVNRAYAQIAQDKLPPPVVPKTPEQIKAEMVASVQRHLDATAKTHGYDGILSLASYAASTHPPFAAEGQAGLDWRDAVWGYCYSVLAGVQAGTRTIPTEAELIAELPVMVWP